MLFLIIHIAPVIVIGEKQFGVLKSNLVIFITIGGLGIWYVIDILIVLLGEFTDSEGKKIKQWI